MDKSEKNNRTNNKNVNNRKLSNDHEDYGYDFVPNLNEWLNIDEQKEKAKKLEDI